MTAELPPTVFATSLESAKEGEVVMICRGYGHRVPRKIARTTPSMIVVDGQSFNRHGSLRGGGTWSSTNIQITDEKECDEVIADLHYRRLSKELSEFKWKDLTADQLRQVSTLCLSFQTKETTNPE